MKYKLEEIESSSLNIIVPDKMVLRDVMSLDALRYSIKKLGLINPIIVMRGPGSQYTLVSGYRRLNCAQQLGMTTIPAFVYEPGSITPELYRLADNVSMVTPEPYQLSQEIVRLRDQCKLDPKIIAYALGLSPVYVRNLARIEDALIPKILEIWHGSCGPKPSVHDLMCFCALTREEQEIEWDRFLGIAPAKPSRKRTAKKTLDKAKGRPLIRRIIKQTGGRRGD